MIFENFTKSVSIPTTGIFLELNTAANERPTNPNPIIPTFTPVFLGVLTDVLVTKTQP